LSKTYCADDGTCQPDPCSLKECVRGTCERGTGQCISSDTCTVNNELFDCVQGERCLNDQCLTPDEFCDELTCDRGVCDFDAGGCVSADDCGGEDSQCLEGEYCTDDNACSENRCVTDNVTCDQGVCVPAVGECRNAESCESTSDCLADHWCVEGSCELQSMACGDAAGDGGCLGNQTCVYDEENLTATCEAPDTCTTSLDCLEGTQCGGESCIAAVTCQDDLYEPNDTEGEATDFLDVASQQLVEGSICASDTDLYTFNVGSLEPTAVRGTLTVSLRYAPRDVGLGQLQVELFAEQGDGSFSSVATGTSGELGQDGGVELTHEVGPSTVGGFRIEVTSVGDLSDAGIRYDLGVDLVDDMVVSECEGARVLESGDILTADLRQSQSSLLQASCTRNPGESSRAEQIFAFDVEESGRATVTVTPESDSNDPVVSIREACTTSGTEVACSDTSAETESIDEKLLDPGTYYAVVSASGDGSLGRYDIALNITSTSCSGASSYCEDASRAQVCVGGTGLTAVDCTNGCEPTTGRCFPIDGNVCETTTEITADTTESIVWGELTDDYQSNGCVPAVDGDTDTSGVDKAFQITIPDQKALRATLDVGDSDAASLYFVEDCQDVSGACLQGVNENAGGDETLIWPNRTGSDVTGYLIADSSEDALLPQSELGIEIVDVVCDPNGNTAQVCDPNNSSQVLDCSEFGLEYNQGESCGSFGCTDGVCQRPTTCSMPFDITSAASAAGGTTVTDDFDNYSSDYSGSDCGVSSGQSDGPDAVFQVELQPNEVLVADTSISTPGSTTYFSSMYLMPTCANLDSTCLAGDAPGSSSSSLSYQNTSGSAQTYFLFLDNDNAGSTTQNFTLDAEIVQGCTPGSPATCSSGNVEYCSPQGFTSTWMCANSNCTSGQCDTRNADFCFESENITSTATQTGGGTINVDFSSKTNASEGVCGLSSSDTSGPDIYYELDLLAGELLSAQLDSSAASGEPALLVTSDCINPDNACLDTDQDSSLSSVVYAASQDETVYLVADTSSSSPGSGYTLDVEISTACSPLGSASCAANGDGLSVCADNGTTQDVSCTACCTAAEYHESTPNAAIPGDGTVFTDTISVSSCSGNVQQVIVGMDITHEYTGDLQIDLENPNGDSVRLQSSSLTPGTEIDGYYPTTLTPDGSLSTLTGSTANGTWTLSIEDTFTFGDIGDINSWSLAVACQ
jgi:subtilisin-like proprotein convertase family protein